MRVDAKVAKETGNGNPQLSDELKRLARMESQFRGEYLKLRAQVRRYILSYKSVVINFCTCAEANACDEYGVIIDMVISAHSKVQEFVTGLVDATRTSYELEVILNHNPDGEPWQVESINITNITIIIMVMITLNVFLNHNPDGEQI